MKPAPEPDNLLDAVLAESAPADFRAALLGETLRRARRRRWKRHAARAAAAVAVACAVGVAVWRSSPRGVAMVSSAANCEVVATQPLPAGALVGTRPFGSERLVASVASVAVVSTADGVRDLRFVNDDELLALAAPRPAALVRVGPHAQELIFVPPPGRDAAPLN